MGRVRYFTFVLVLAAAVLPRAVPADTTPAPNGVYRSFESGKPARDAGVIHGEIEDVDYGAGTIVVRTAKGHVPVSVLPSTTIYEHDEYATLADLHRGATVDISVSEVDGRLVAQIIRLK